MTQTQETVIVRYLGGESGHRSFFGGTQSKTRIAGVAGFIILGMVGTPMFGWPAVLVAAAGALVTILVTINTHRGSVLDRREKRRRWKDRVKRGTDAYTPFDVARHDQLEKTIEDAHAQGRGGREAAWQAHRELVSMRRNPDGVDGMGWLQCGRGEAGIQWHTPGGEDAYLAATFAVTGQLQGIESGAVMRRAGYGWGRFLSMHAAPTALAEYVQGLTRVLPADSALQEFWVKGNLDPKAPEEAKRSYETVLRLSGQDAMVQRHYFTVRWPITAAFTDAASKYGEGRDGWRGLMHEEIRTVATGLADARMGTVEVLTARQIGAVILHQQNPSRPIDYVADVRPEQLGIASHDEFSSHVVRGIDPVTGSEVEWWHRTAAIRGGSLTVAPRPQLWLLELLVSSELTCTRSLSFHHGLIPAAEAKNAAQQDVVRDMSASIGDAEAGRISDGDDEIKLSAAQRRRNDLRAGTGHHGEDWIGFITISTRSRDELASASRQLANVCATGLGIERLDWQDSYQSAASGTTWPIARGLRKQRGTLSSALYSKLAGTSEKEALS